MTDDMNTQRLEAPNKGGKKGLIIGLLLAIIGGAGSFYTVYNGLILGTDTDFAKAEKPNTEPLPPISFVPLDPLTITVGPGGTRQLKFRAELEVDPQRSDDVVTLMPRILDMLNGYLRAVDIEVLQDPIALIQLRAQMLRRVQIVTGNGHVLDLLITEFVFI